MSVIRAAAAIPFLELLRERAVEPHPVIQSAGLTPAIFDDPENVIPYAQLCRFVAAATAAASCEHLCLLGGARITLASLGLLGPFVRAHPDVRTALHRLVQYLHLHDRGAGLVLTDSDGNACLSYMVAEAAEGADLVCGGAIAVAFNAMKALAGPTWRPTEVLLPMRAPADPRPFTTFFAAPVRFEAGVAALLFSARWLDRPVQTADADLQRLLERWVIESDDHRPGQFHKQVGRIMRTLILTARPTVDNVAAACGLATRALTRRLAGEGLSFRELLEREKFDIARQLLAGSDQPIARIAAAIGYSEPAAFMHAFRRWAGAPPAEWRKARRS